MAQEPEMKNGMKLSEIVETLGMKVVHRGKDFDTAMINIRDVNRPGLQLVGFFDYFDERRLQVIGMMERKMLKASVPRSGRRAFPDSLNP